MNLFQYQCYLHAKAIRVDLGNGKYRLVSSPRVVLSNGPEGYNSIFQASKAKARGYIRFDTIQAIINLLT